MKPRFTKHTVSLCPGNHFDRPGITSETLHENGIINVDARTAGENVGISAAGIMIPYHTRDGDEIGLVYDPDVVEFARLRLAKPSEGGHKYHQRAGTSVHTYLPRHLLQEPPQGGSLVLVEGEFKALSLMDHRLGFAVPAVGLSGFFGFHRKRESSSEGDAAPEFTNELDWALKACSPSEIFYLGDNDTAFNAHFSFAAFRLVQMLGQTIRLPLININMPKGIDDCRAELGNKFERFIRDAMDDAIEVAPDDTPDEIAVKLVEPQLPLIKSMLASERTAWMPSLVKLIARVGDGARGVLFDLVKSLKLTGVTELRKQVKTQQQQDHAEIEQDILQKLDGRVFFDSKHYYLKNDGRFQSAGREDVLLALNLDFDLYGRGSHGRTVGEHALLAVQNHHRVDWAGSVAGRAAGLMEAGGRRLLITDSPRVIPGSLSGRADLVAELVGDLMGRTADEFHYHEQVQRLLGWVASRRRALQHPDQHLPGQILVLVGDADVGKSFLVDNVLVPMLGGRCEDALDVLLEGGRFNDRLFGAEVVKVGDAKADPDNTRQINSFQTALFRMVSEQSHVFSKKFGDSVSLFPIWSVVMTMNPTPDSLQLLRLNDMAMRDKLLVLRCHRSDLLPGHDPMERRGFLARINDSLPAFAGQLDAFALSQELVGGRFGVEPFQHPRILELANAAHLPTLVARWLDELLRESGSDPLLGMARDFWAKLEQTHGSRFVGLVPDARDMGKLMVAIPREVPGWAKRIRQDGKAQTGQSRNYATVWRIWPPVS